MPVRPPLFCLLLAALASLATAAERPNVVLVMTDDQGYGDVHAHGNEIIRTPNLDALREQSVRLTDYHVDPTCSPTRSALMTGRYSSRTGVWHTIMGRSLMHPDEVTLAEVFADNGYATGIFGKWHLGDNFPLRPQDQGFQQVFVHGGGGVSQTPDYWGNDYFDDTYFRNGHPEKVEGYCTDVWFDAAMQFIETSRKLDRPFFCYVPTNAPHGPFNVADEYADPYREQGVPEAQARFWGMITNIDENVGRLRKKLNELGLAENTIFVFTTDNGTAAGAGGPKGFNDGMRGRKGSEYDGGHRVPFFVTWPAGGIGGGRDVDTLTAHVDVLPTLVELCGLDQPADALPIEGTSLAPLLQKAEFGGWAGRTLFVHSQRVEIPQKWRKSAVMTERWRLVNGDELYDVEADPGQERDVADEHPAVVKRLRAEYEDWWQSIDTRFDDYVRIGLGSEAENPANLTCHDWHTGGGKVPWNQGSIRAGVAANGFWAIDVTRPGRYRITLRNRPAHVKHPLAATEATVEVDLKTPGGEAVAEGTRTVNPDDTAAGFELTLPEGQGKLTTTLKGADGKTRGAYFVEVERVD